MVNNMMQNKKINYDKFTFDVQNMRNRAKVKLSKCHIKIFKFSANRYFLTL